MEEVRVLFRTGPDPSKLKELLGEGYRITALLLEKGGEWDLVAVDHLEKGDE